MRQLDHKNESGFSLIELAIVTVIFGFVVSTVAYVMSIQMGQSGRLDTLKSLRTSHTAINEFLAVTGRYPCPADPSLGPGDPLHGREVCAAPFGAVVRTQSVGVDRDNDTTDDFVLIGSVPFATLIDPDNDPQTDDGIMESRWISPHTVDGWDRKLTYAVTENLTATPTYNDLWGAIKVEDEDGDSVTEPPNSTHFVLVSHGENLRGSYSWDGVAPTGDLSCVPLALPPPGPPPPPVPTNLNETENCDNVDGKFVKGLRNTSPFSFNDDFIRFQNMQITALWRIVGAVGPQTAPIFQAANLNPGRVGINVENPQQQLHVGGSLVSTSFVKAEQICDRTGTFCLEPSTLGGDRWSTQASIDMQCDNDNEVVTKIDSGTVKPCTAVPALAAPPFNGFSCPAGEFIVGMTTGGTVLCEPLLP